MSVYVSSGTTPNGVEDATSRATDTTDARVRYAYRNEGERNAR